MPEEKEILYKPKDMYDRMLKKQYHDTALAYFAELLSKSGVNEQENAKLVKQYEEAKAQYEKEKKAFSGIKFWKVFLTVLSIIFGIVGIGALIIGIMTLTDGVSDYAPAFFITSGVSIALTVLFIVLELTVIKKKFAEQEKKTNDAKEKMEKAYAAVLKSVESLNRIYDWGIPQAVMEKATPIIDLDPVFMGDRLQYLIEKFKFHEVTSPKQSVLEVLSGNIHGNPFVLQKILDCSIVDRRYTGSLTIHWTTTYRDKNGTHTQHHSQTLTASIERPAPTYKALTQLVYGSEAAPDLHFSRKPAHAEKMSDSEREKYINKTIKKLDSKEAKDLGRSENFTKLGNDEFDALFGAFDRDNEIQFRLLYTPLAQKNTLELLKDKSPFGDDFYLKKNGMTTIVQSEHSQKFDYSSEPSTFFGYDVAKMKEKFVNYCDDFIKNLFFDLAPIISVPLYQMHKPKEYIYETPYRSNLSSFEQEVLANDLDVELFKPKGASNNLPLILKAKDAAKRGSGDSVKIDAMSFVEIPMVEYIPRRGGDGRTHLVPVHWIKYEEVHKQSNIGISQVNGTREKYLEKRKNNFGGAINPICTTFERGLMAIFEGDNEYLEDINNTIVDLFKD